MRITQNNLTQLSISMNKLPPEIKAQLGKVISGHITQIQSDKVATLVSGTMALTVDISGAKLSENQMVNIQITGYEEGAFTAKLVPDSITGEQKSQMDYALVFDKLGLPQTEENRQILDAMIKSNLPTSSDTFARMRQGMLEVKIVAGELKQTEAPILTRNDFDVPMKALAIKLIQTAQEFTAVKEAPVLLDKSTALDQMRALPLDLMDTKAIEQKWVNASSTSSTHTQNLQPALSPLDLERFISQVVNTTGDTPVAKEPILNLFNQFSHFDESMLIKHELPLTIKNMFLSSMGVFQSEKTVERFIRVLNQLENTLLSDGLRHMLSEVLSAQSDPIEKLNQLLEVIRKSQMPVKEKTSIENDLSILKESANLIKSFNEQVMYLPVPVIIHKEPEIAHLYLKKGKQKFNPDDLTLLVALNTHHYGEVRVLIHKKDTHVDLKFSFETEVTKVLFESLQDQLSSALSKFTMYHFSTSFSVKQEALDLEFEASTIASFGFDLKV